MISHSQISTNATIQRSPGVASRMPNVAIYPQTSYASANPATSAMERCTARTWTSARYQVHAATIPYATIHPAIIPARVKTDSRETRSIVWVHQREQRDNKYRRLKWIITSQFPCWKFFSNTYLYDDRNNNHNSHPRLIV